MATKLESLLIKEISGVDDPANEIPGWMVAKAADKKPYGDVKYADPGLQEDGKERYPLDTEEHIRAAWDYINKDENAAKYSAADLKKVKGAIQAAMKKIGADVSKEAAATSIVEKIKQILHGKDDLEMTQEELEKALDTRDERLVETIKSLLPSTEAPSEGAPVAPEAPAAPAEPEPAPVPITADDVVKAVKEAVDPLLEIIEPMLNRIEGLEKGTAVRKSLDGQESADEKGEPKEPTLGDAIKAAFRSPATPVNA